MWAAIESFESVHDLQDPFTLVFLRSLRAEEQMSISYTFSFLNWSVNI